MPSSGETVWDLPNLGQRDLLHSLSKGDRILAGAGSPSLNELTDRACLWFCCPFCGCPTAGRFRGRNSRFFAGSERAPDTRSDWFGDYYLSNLMAKLLAGLIVFPVPSSSEIGSATNIELDLIEPADSMAVELMGPQRKGFSFRLDCLLRSFAKLRISYNQKIRGKTAPMCCCPPTPGAGRFPSVICHLTLGPVSS